MQLLWLTFCKNYVILQANLFITSYHCCDIITGGAETKTSQEMRKSNCLNLRVNLTFFSQIYAIFNSPSEKSATYMFKTRGSTAV